MAVNNETGVKTDIEAIAAIAQEHKIPFFVDAVALMGKEEFRIPTGVSAMAFSGHKFHAPKGIGFLMVRSSLKLAPLLIGGDQEYGKRAGTENLSGITGMATAIEILRTELPSASKRMEELRNKFEHELMQRLPDVSINGQGPRVVNTSNLAFQGVEGETLLTALDLAGIAVSHGSACASGALEPSRILLNMGCSKEVAASSIRFSLSRFTTQQEIEFCIEAIVKVVLKLRH
jgi:cysteine desulfurase